MPWIPQDARFALKLLARQKGFTAAALLTLALCIGANTAIFSVLNSVILRPLPFEGADRLVRIYNSYPRAGIERGGASAPDYFDRLEHVPALDAVAMIQPRGVTIGEEGLPERAVAAAVTPSFFAMLGVPAAMGRTFVDAEGEPGNERHAILSHGLWQEHYGGRTDLVGSTIRISEVAHTIVGVMPPGFVFERQDVRLWVPLAFSDEQRSDDSRHSNNWEMIALLRPGASPAQAQQQIDALNTANDERLPQFGELLAQVGFRTVVVDYRADLVRDVRGTLWLLQAGVLVVLLIGCVNIANLVLVRASARHRELATRAALGAGRRRLAGQLLTESLLLALLGGAAGVLLGWGAVRAFGTFLSRELPRSTEIALDGTALVAALGATVLAGLFFGAVPVLRLLGADLSTVFRDEGRSGTAGRSTRALRGGLVVAQVALAFVLLVGAGLMLVSFARTLGVDPGFGDTSALVASVSLPLTRYPDEAARHTFATQLIERVRALPGIERAALSSLVPFGSEMNASAVTPEGYDARPDDPVVAPVVSSAGDGYFEAMDIDVIAGRSFTAADATGTLPVAIVDRYLADRFWPGQDPLGKRLAQGVQGLGNELAYRTVVGVVDNVRVVSLTGDQPLGHYYVPLAQEPAARLFIVVKGALPPAVVTSALRGAVSELDPHMPVYDVRTMAERLAESVTTERLRMVLLVAFGVLALFLAAVGIYGVLAYSVAQRAAEIGIRMALGSTAAAIFAMVLRQGAVLIGLGLAIGVAGSFALGRVVQSMLYGVGPTDPRVFLVVLAVLAGAAFAACLLPAGRATRVDPAVALRDGG
jgi:putative ABC transport system permease protein